MINTSLVLVSFSVYTYNRSNTMVEDKGMVTTYSYKKRLSSGEMLASLLIGLT